MSKYTRKTKDYTCTFGYLAYNEDGTKRVDKKVLIFRVPMERYEAMHRGEIKLIDILSPYQQKMRDKAMENNILLVPEGFYK